MAIGGIMEIRKPIELIDDLHKLVIQHFGDIEKSTMKLSELIAKLQQLQTKLPQDVTIATCDFNITNAVFWLERFCTLNHGDYQTYTSYGCRCELCTAAAAQRQTA